MVVARDGAEGVAVIDIALLLALALGRPVGLVSTVYDVAGIDGVALVEYESRFNERAVRREPRGFTSFGLFQLDSEWHPQWRDDLLLHIVEGASFWEACKAKAGGNIAVAFSWYNSGSPSKSIKKGLEVARLRDRLARRIAEAYGVRE